MPTITGMNAARIKGSPSTAADLKHSIATPGGGALFTAPFIESR